METKGILSNYVDDTDSKDNSVLKFEYEEPTIEEIFIDTTISDLDQDDFAGWEMFIHDDEISHAGIFY